MKKEQALQRGSGRLSIFRDERGLSTVEYVVLLVLICAACVGLWAAFGDVLTDKLGGATNEFDSNVPTYGEGSGTENR
jgi:Flp pilus assembly pilin Flp